ncbi:type II secretion system secretin GspD [Pararobbsia silviterrae]|uniref:Type II secretion system protein GspD n=1 Tax=Pararobbsia silviterrae TaxID=1792498 RepID=A0A494YDU8_9BURK|nr:type II secretion system secretin GspD [Pararobbsia silviterrae]RKP58513.1 type II secretion system protein GspD [Pararobbsia silviterrae]
MTRKLFAAKRIVRALALAGLMSAAAAHAQVTLNFVNADIDQVAKAIGAATNQTIIVDPRVKGQINLVSEQPVPEDQAIKILTAALRMQGFAMVTDHGVLKVVPEADAKLQGVPTYVGNAPVARGDSVVTQVFQLHSESANNLLPVLRPLITPNNTIAAYPANNSIVVTDYADNVRRIASIIQGIDGGAGQADLAVVPLKNANAIDLAAELVKLLDPGAVGNTDATLKVAVLADARTNSLMLRTSNAARMEMAKRLVAQLDASTREPGNMHVVQLRNADAVTLAKTLHGMLGESSGSSSSSSSNSKDSFNQNNGGMSSGVGSSSSSSSSSSSTTPLPTGMGTSSGSGSSGGQGGLLGGSSKDNSDDNQAGGMIQADAATNSLIITAPDPVYRNLRNVIDQLDQRRAQVYIESLIVEMANSDSSALGIQWQGIVGGGNTRLFGGTNYGTSGNNIIDLTAAGYSVAGGSTTALSTAVSSIQQGLNVGLLHNFGGNLALGALLQALGTIGNVNVLSTPNMITLDNEEARIVVGQNIPILTGSYAQTGTTSTVSPFQTYDRQDVGITLHVKPQITEGGVIKLQIYEESSSVAATTSLTATQGATINKRSIQSTVMSDDGRIIVLGGLIQDQYSDSANKVPLLGDLPWIGGLFRSESKSRTKTNLMVFLRPVIMRDAAQSDSVSLDRYDYIRAVTADFKSDNHLVPNTEIPLPPPRSGSAPATGNLGVIYVDPKTQQPLPQPQQIPPGAMSPSLPNGISVQPAPAQPAVSTPVPNVAPQAAPVSPAPSSGQ